jgi:hypothetical protein
MKSLSDSEHAVEPKVTERFVVNLEKLKTAIEGIASPGSVTDVSVRMLFTVFLKKQ